ncbi:hypothetical protein ACIBKX_20800 [Streptomyces sp. NPDC050658]|uniref:hypothetical protein n=1 Tax=unclassified Streptomyces TaxID=2593676 RepID=UPI0034311828
MTNFAHRVVVLLSVNGLRTDCEAFEAACAEQGWAILEQPEHPTGRQLSVVPYTVEIRVPGAYRGAVRGARLAVVRVGQQRRLDLNVRVADRLQPDSRNRALWYSYVEMPTAAPRHVPDWAWRRVRRTATSARLRDTERGVWASTEAEALRLARHPLPGVTPAPPGIRVRSVAKNPETAWGMKWASRINEGRLAHLCAVALLSGAFVPNALLGGIPFLMVAAVLGLTAVCVWCVMLVRNQRGKGEGTYKDTLLICGASTSMLALGAGTAVVADWSGFWLIVLLAGVTAVAQGLYLFIRQRTWQTWVPWVLPALLPLVFGVFPGIGSFVHLAYLDAFGVSLGDVGVPVHWQLAAALRWGVLVLILLVGPAVYGYLRHHHLAVENRQAFGFAIAFGLVASCVTAGSNILDDARWSGTEARRVAASGKTPPTYYGIDPEWVCVKPLKGVDPAELPVQGGEFDPSRRYLMLGDSGGTVVLWDRGSSAKPSRTTDDQTLKLPLAELRVAPAGKRC